MQAFLIDSSIYIFRSHFTLPENWHAPDNGFPTHAVYGFTSFMIDLLRQKQPEFIFCAFDESLHSGFRHQLCPDVLVGLAALLEPVIGVRPIHVVHISATAVVKAYRPSGNRSLPSIYVWLAQGHLCDPQLS